MYRRKIVPFFHYIFLILFLVFFSSCSNKFWNQVSEGYMLSQGVNQQITSKLMLFGGTNNQTYLGCVNCSSYDKDSIFNEYGTYGNSYSSSSIWNSYGSYGSTYSKYSPWNPYATNPPIVVDSKGKFYGYFTVNKYKTNRTRIAFLLNILKRH